MLENYPISTELNLYKRWSRASLCFGIGVVQFSRYVLPENVLVQLEDLLSENSGRRFSRNNVTCALRHTTSHQTEEKTRFILLTKSHSNLRVWTAVSCFKIFTALLTLMRVSKEPNFYTCLIEDDSREINPTRCNNCVYSSQCLYSTCFGWQFHPSSGVHMPYMAFQVGRYNYVVILSVLW